MASHNELGNWGEGIAADYMESLGYTILERNWHFQHKEVDIIACNLNTGIISFVEVKTRRNNIYLEPEQAVDGKKMWFLSTAANYYVRSHRIDFQPQFDIISIVGTPDTGYKLNHIPDAFTPAMIYR